MSQSVVETVVSGLSQGVGVFLGVIAGVATALGVGWWKDRRAREQELRNLWFELDVNITKIGAWLDEVTRWCSAISGDNLLKYFSWFDLSTALVSTTNAMFVSGKLYDVLSHEHIAKLQEVFKDLSPAGEQYLNNQIGQKKQQLAQLIESGRGDQWGAKLKQECIEEATFWQRKLQDHRKALSAARDAVEKRIGHRRPNLH